MGKAGRFFCIFTPMALTLASLLCLAFVFMGSTNKGSSLLSDLYFFKADASNFTANPSIDLIKGTDIDDNLLKMLQKTAEDHTLKDFYTVGLWNYCEGDHKVQSTEGSVTSSFNSSTETITWCSSRQSSFWFNPVQVFGLNDTAYAQYIPKELNDGLKIYEKVAKFMFAIYVVAIATTAAEILIGIFAIFSRWGSCVTSIVSGATTLFTLVSALTSTILYSTLAGTFNTVLEPYEIHASLGARMLAVVWLAFAFSFAAGLFWTISMCCCSGKSDKRGRRGVTAEKTPYTYERVGPFGAGGDRHSTSSQVPLQNMNQHGRESAYEPFRHHDARV